MDSFITIFNRSNTQQMFTGQELLDIELWRAIKEPTKGNCIAMQDLKFRITNIKEKASCFCSSGDRRRYKEEFFKFWDSQPK